MRISDWSSDVCSSDLVPLSWIARSRATAAAASVNEWVGTGSGTRIFASLGIYPDHLPRRGGDQASASRPLKTSYAPTAGYRGRQAAHGPSGRRHGGARSEEHTSELQSLMRISYAVFCLKK